MNGQSTASGLLPGRYPVMVYDLGSGTACGGSYSNTITISAPSNSLQLTNFVTMTQQVIVKVVPMDQ